MALELAVGQVIGEAAFHAGTRNYAHRANALIARIAADGVQRLVPVYSFSSD